MSDMELSPEIKQKLDTFLNDDMMSGMFGGQDNVHAIKYFVELGEKVEELYFRANFFDDMQVVDAAQVEASCDEFHYERGKQRLRKTIAGRASIKGERMKDLKEAIIGQIAQAKRNGNSGSEWLKRKAGMEQ